MAQKQGITREELEELFLLLTIYAGFNKAGVFYAELLRIYGPK
jgi:alkylhydroperoxidase/carboxymuconolactone decarboxylase family protein YurZ